MTVKVDPSNQVKLLEKHEPRPSAEEVEQAKVVLQDAVRTLALSSDVIGSVIIGTCRRVPTSAIDTMAVTIAGDGFAMLLYNPSFVIKLGAQQATFVLSHEAGHLLWRHLYVDPTLHGNKAWETACEASLNHWVSELLKQDLPVVPDKDGKPEESGVNPRKVWEDYRKDLKAQGKEHVSYQDFITPDLQCFAEIERMSKPPRQRGAVCVHHDPNGGANLPGGGADGQVPLDQEELDRAMEDILQTVMHDARVNENKHAKEQLLKLADQTKGSEKAEKTWGNLGLGALRGEAVETERVDYWKQWVSHVLAERLQPGNRLRYLKKIWWDPRLAFRGDEPYRRVLVATDASGSMHTNVLNYIRRLCGMEEGLETVYASWDADMWALDDGEAFRGGGGTDLQCVLDYVEGRHHVEGLPEVDGSDHYDAIVVITDGFFSPRMPEDPDRWIFLITPGGNEWPGEHGMDCRQLPEDCEEG